MIPGTIIAECSAVFLNALLAMLNARKSIRSQMGNGAVVSVHMATTTETDRCSDSGDLESGRGQNWGRVRMIVSGVYPLTWVLRLSDMCCGHSFPKGLSLQIRVKAGEAIHR